MMNKKTIFAFIVISTLFLVSCSSQEGNIHTYRTGTQGLDMKLVNPGTEDFFEGDSFEILVEYFNKGTADITNGQFFVSGYDQQYMRITPDPNYINIDGKDEYDPDGRNSQILVLKSNVVRLPENSDQFSQTLKVISCYDYATFASAEICVDPDPNGRRATKKICTMSPVSPGGQGAPVAVTYVEPIVTKGEDFRLNIHFSNQDDGIVYDRGLSPSQCYSSLDKYQDRDRVDVINVDFSGRSMHCTPDNPVRLVNGQGKVTCECKNCINGYMDAFNTQISIELRYGYRNEITKNIRILQD